MSETAIVTIIVAILAALGGGGGIWGYKQFKKEEPVKKRDSDIAAADTSVQMALAIAKAAKEHSEAVGKELETERGARQHLSGRVDGLETHIRELNSTIRALREAVRVLTVWGNDIVARWQVIRMHQEPPPMPHIRID